MSNFNYASITATSRNISSNFATTTVSAANNKVYQIVGFDGNSSDQSFQVQLKFGSTVKLTMHGAADTNAGRAFGEIGPVAEAGEDISLTTRGDASGEVVANLMYRIVQ